MVAAPEACQTVEDLPTPRMGPPNRSNFGDESQIVYVSFCAFSSVHSLLRRLLFAALFLGPENRPILRAAELFFFGKVVNASAIPSVVWRL